MMDEQAPHVDYSAPRRGSLPWMVIWTIAAFIGGTLVSVGMGWGTRSGQLDALTVEVARLTGSVSILSEKYTNTDKTTGMELQKLSDHLEKMEDHLSHTDGRIERLEGRR